MDDISAIASWERAEQPPDTNAGGYAHPYRCTACDWTGRGEAGLKHYRATGHAIRGRHWPASWGNCLWSFPPEPLVSACAWCSDHGQRLADAALAGRKVTSGICAKHAAEFRDGR